MLQGPNWSYGVGAGLRGACLPHTQGYVRLLCAMGRCPGLPIVLLLLNEGPQ